MRRTAYFQGSLSDSDSDSEPDTSEESAGNGLSNYIPRQQDTKPFDHHLFREASKFDPSPDNFPALDTYCKTTRLSIYKFETKPCKFDNLLPGEKQAIKELTNNPNIIIKPADKGGCTVIMNTVDYIAEAERQLSNREFYLPQTTDLTPIHNQKVKTLIDRLTNTAISEEVAKFLFFEKPRTPSIYFLPKIHKETRPPPGRPIVSANSCPTERISGLVDYLLRPYVPQLPSYVKDTTDFINKIEQIPRLESEALLVTLDVTSLYTNIPNQESLEVALHTLNTNRDDTEHPLKNTDIVEMLNLVLTCNNFEFNNQHFLQTQGVAMGTRVAPTIANLVMGHFEEKFVYTYHLRPLIWLRYIDDNFMIWTHGKEALDEFIAHLNSVHPSIKFTHEASPASVNFLDTTVIKDHTGHLYTTLYTKPTDTHAYLHYASCHPHHQKTSGPYGQLLRLRRICYRQRDFLREAHILLQHYQKRGYPHPLLAESLEKALNQDRATLLTPKTKPPQDLANRPLFCVIPYNPSNPPIKDILRQNWHILETDPKLKCFMEKELIIGHSRPKNLKDILVSSKLRYKPSPTTSPNTTPNPSKLCTRRQCRYCKLCDHSGAIRSTTTGRRYIIPQHFSCEFNNLIYAITCKKCKKQYVGQTSNNIRTRFQKHLKDIEHAGNWSRDPDSYKRQGKTNVGRHFSEQQHTKDDVTIQVLELIPVDPKSELANELRLTREHHWMHQLKTIYPSGINATDGSNHNRPNRNARRKPPRTRNATNQNRGTNAPNTVPN